MTREEAIGTMNYLKHYAETDTTERNVLEEKDRVRFIEAVEMAIQALSQEPCDDAISREAALEKMADYVASGYADSAEDFEEYSRIICQLPSVTPQEKYGKWIVHEKPHGIRYLECPYCNTWYLNEHLIRNSYCPNCGARMIEPQESEDKTE